MDRRVKRTINAIESAFIQLLKTYDLEEITIQQIADLADINRATFYTYYQDKYELLTTLEDREIERIKEKVDHNKLRQTIMNDADNIKNLIKETPQQVIQVILKNITLYEVLFNMKRESRIEAKLSESIAQKITLVVKNQKDINGIPFRYFHSFYAGVAISCIKFWVLDPNRIPEDEFIEHIYTLMYKGPLQQLISEVSKQSTSQSSTIQWHEL
ncbi:TetR family regulatory protein [Staphylococcus microti]|uniref:TetR family regulatory protein n=1 Tax=Staphylococcus microti TaxID=569857 RepID=A0A380GRP6_9STAP|nr:TetR/AcrR family transcriptional regulator C-terminal domain-containing protein [Staphylococcus microti]PNZ77539.1 TetR/AcrR family transcriptional regulator [Staphylococcus microti]SUM56433.1 TetR family regulatory protein [Staphylococcus microti]